MISDSNPVFVKIEKYKDILEIIDAIDKKLEGAKDVLSEIEELKHKEDEEIALWQKNIDDITHKMDVIKDEMNE
ncbi:hypothetical protein JW826_00690 [Candidatus Woesearchaeota archaeon]|nr:hypothetical protein [Candidatus Woesearchaeota archaeon]